MKNIIIVIALFFGVLFSSNGYAQSYKMKNAVVNCEQNPMVSGKQYCSSEFIQARNGLYKFGTTDNGSEPLLTVIFVTNNRFDADTLLVKAGDNIVNFVVRSSNSRIFSCSGGCSYWTSLTVNYDDEFYSTIKDYPTILVAFKDGAYTSNPIEVNSSLITAWLDNWNQIP